VLLVVGHANLDIDLLRVFNFLLFEVILNLLHLDYLEIRFTLTESKAVLFDFHSYEMLERLKNPDLFLIIVFRGITFLWVVTHFFRLLALSFIKFLTVTYSIFLNMRRIDILISQSINSTQRRAATLEVGLLFLMMYSLIITIDLFEISGTVATWSRAILLTNKDAELRDLVVIRETMHHIDLFELVIVRNDDVLILSYPLECELVISNLLSENHEKRA
jgi:hypothetical protein